VAQQAWSEKVSNRVADQLSLPRWRVHRSIMCILTEAEREFANKPVGGSYGSDIVPQLTGAIRPANAQMAIVPIPVFVEGGLATDYRQRVAPRLNRQLDEWADTVYDTCLDVLNENHIAKTPKAINTIIYEIVLPEIRRELKLYLAAVRRAEKSAGKLDLFWYGDDLLHIFRREREDVEQAGHDLIKRWRNKGEETGKYRIPLRTLDVDDRPEQSNKQVAKNKLTAHEQKIWEVIQRGAKGLPYCGSGLF
jgi:hypothetical protein